MLTNSIYGLSSNLRYDNVSCCFPLQLDWVLGFRLPFNPTYVVSNVNTP